MCKASCPASKWIRVQCPCLTFPDGSGRTIINDRTWIGITPILKLAMVA